MQISTDQCNYKKGILIFAIKGVKLGYIDVQQYNLDVNYNNIVN